MPAPAYVLPLALLGVPGRPQRHHQRAAGPRRAAVVLGGVALPARRRQAARAGRAAAPGCCSSVPATLRPGLGHERRVGPRPVRRRRASPCCSRGWPTPPSASPTPTPTAAGAPAWRTGLLLALGAAFAPLTYWFALVLAVLVIGAGFVISARAMRDRSVWGPPAAALLVPAGAAGALVGARRAPRRGRRPRARRRPAADGDRRLRRPRRPGTSATPVRPAWLGLLLLAVAVLALVPSRHPDPGARLLDRGARGGAGRRRRSACSPSSGTPWPPRPGSASSSS